MFAKLNPKSLNENFFKTIGDEWMLITAGDNKNHNMMTASWGFFGIIWGKPSAVVAVRPQRYTLKFLNNNDYFTLSFYGDKKYIHEVCGTMSGKDINKTEKLGLHPISDEDTGAVYFKEARLVFVCRKVYCGKLQKDNFLDNSIYKKNYPADDLHSMFIGEIVSVLKNDEQV